MNKKNTCRICGSDFSNVQDICPGCGTPVTVLVEEVHVPVPLGPVNDFAGVLSKDQKSELHNLVDAFFRKSDIPIILNTIYTTEPLHPSEYAFLLYNQWGIGHPDTNRGVLILLALKERHVESEIGFGLEDVLPEEIGDRIVQEEFVPCFKSEKYFEGLRSGTEAIINYLSGKLPSQ